MPEKSAVSPKALIIPISFRVSSRAASAEMENFGMERFTLLWNKRAINYEATTVLFVQRFIAIELVAFEIIPLLLVERCMPFPDVLLADDALHFLHLSYFRQDNHHGGVALVGQQDDSNVVVVVPMVIKTAHLFHHVHLNLGVLIHVELALDC